MRWLIGSRPVEAARQVIRLDVARSGYTGQFEQARDQGRSVYVSQLGDVIR